VNDAELKKTFPFGAMVIPRTEDDISFPAVVGGESDEEETFTVWENPFHDTELSRDLTASGDGYVTEGPNHKKYFLRPLAKKDKVVF
jgi:hypothetical protein